MTVIELGHADLVWEWSDGAAGVQVGPLDGWKRRAKVDPWPAYPHDAELVHAEVARMASVLPLPEPFAPTWYVLSHEPLERMNGWTDRMVDHWWEQGDQPSSARPWRPWIVLAGKRVPPHPAMTRYLVAHEYGHVVDYWLQRLAGMDPGQPDSDWDAAYAELRGVEVEATYHGPAWHRSIGELIACDFRILVAKTEREFWPHPGIARPEELPQVRRWWREQLRRVADERRQREAAAA